MHPARFTIIQLGVVDTVRPSAGILLKRMDSLCSVLDLNFLDDRRCVLSHLLYSLVSVRAWCLTVLMSVMIARNTAVFRKYCIIQ
jgi:hypothetical protein